jgi:cytochrome c biogenesis protein CcmG/thiol:disulfide interchange protein DsbE
MRHTVFVVVAALLVAGCSLAASSNGGRGVASADGGTDFAPDDRQPAPAVAGPTLDRSSLALDELGGPVVLNFWASWCDPCRAEAKVLERGHKGADGVLFLGLDTQDAREDARDFIDQFGLTFPHVRDPGNATQRAWGVTGLPETYFIAADGRVVGHVIGTVDAAQLRDGVAAAKAGRPQGADQGGEQRPVD